MTRLFYKDLKAHESAYRDARADEAVNDLLLGAKVNAYTSLEEAKNNRVDEIATNYGKFLKALKTKDIPLLNRSTIAENKVSTAAQTTEDKSSSISDNILMPSQRSSASQQTSTESLTDDLTPEQKKINTAFEIVTKVKEITAVMSNINQIFSPSMKAEFKNILKDNNVSTHTGRKAKGTNKNIKSIKKKYIEEALKEMYNKY